jgi:hypothetical protein
MRSARVTRAIWIGVLIVCASLVADSAQKVEQESTAVPVADTTETLVDEAFLEEVRARLIEAERLEDFYFYRERRTDLNTNPFGRLGTGDVELYEVYPSEIRDLTYRRLVAENGVPLSGEDLAEQDRAYHERAAEVRQRLAREASALELAPSEKRVATERKRAEAQARAREQTEDVLQAMRFTVVRREMFEGSSAIVVAFGPAPGADPETRRGDMASKFVGTAWIDEEDRELRYVEASSVDSISFGLGLALRISEGAAARMRWEPIAEGAWMPSSMTFTGSGRAVLFLRGLSIDYSIEWFDYRPAAEVPVPGAPDPPSE